MLRLSENERDELLDYLDEAIEALDLVRRIAARKKATVVVKETGSALQKVRRIFKRLGG